MKYLTNGKLGEILVSAGMLSIDDLLLAFEENRKHPKERLGETLIRMNLLNDIDLAKALAFQLEISYVDLATAPVDPQAVKLIPRKLAIRKHIFPIAIEKKTLILAMSDPQDLEANDMASFASGLKVRPLIAAVSAIEKAIQKYYGKEEEEEEEEDRAEESIATIIQEVPRPDDMQVIDDESLSEDGILELKRKSELAPIVKLVNSIIFQGISAQASDIHIEPQEQELVVRSRVDGVLSESMRTPGWLHAALVSRIKIMADMDIAKRRIPQDGRVKVRLQNDVIDLRISTLPTQYGEKVVIRILDTEKNILSLKDLGFLPKELEKISELIHLPQGMILVCGPTGSGKTTTLYALMNEIVQKQINIVTLEDPIEYRMKRVNQVQINEKAGLTFAASLRSILRQDPDVILVGETRDSETAETALRASMTGHLVLSTLHTNDAVSTITRLKNLGIEPYLIASALSGIISQRLVRAICKNCREEYEPEEESLSKIEKIIGEKVSFPFYRGKGCEACRQTGYRGRIGIYEILTMNRGLRKLVSKGAPEGQLREEARKNGMRALMEDLLEKLKQGTTTIEEFERMLFQYEKPEARGPVTCEQCQKPVKPEWQICPYCSHRLTSSIADEREDLSKRLLCKDPGASTRKWGLTEEGEESSSSPMFDWNNDAFVESKILLVDPDEATVEKLTAFLTENRFRVASVSNPKDALDHIIHDRPHLVITENTTPDMDGLELLRQIRQGKETALLPVMILSQKEGTMDQWGGFMLGADDYVTKPCSATILLCRIKAILRRVYH